MTDDPFADESVNASASANATDTPPLPSTQPIDDADEKATLSSVASRLPSSSSLCMGATGGSLASSVDSLSFLLDGLSPDQSERVRKESAIQLMRKVMNVTEDGQKEAMNKMATTDGKTNQTKLASARSYGKRSSSSSATSRPASLQRQSSVESDAMHVIMRACNGFEVMAERISESVEKKDNKVLAVMFVSLCFWSSSDRANACKYGPRTIQLLLKFALNTMDHSYDAATEQNETVNGENDNGATAGAIRRSGKRRQARASVTAADCHAVLYAHQQRMMVHQLHATEESHERTRLEDECSLHFQCLQRLDYLAFSTLATMSDDPTFVQRMMQNGNAEIIKQLVAHMPGWIQCIKQHEAEVKAAMKGKSQVSRRRSSSRATMATTAPSSSSSKTSASVIPLSVALLHHRLLCSVTMVENMVQHLKAAFSVLAQSNEDAKANDDARGVENKTAQPNEDQRPRPSPSIMQTIFDAIALYSHNIHHHQSASGMNRQGECNSGETTTPSMSSFSSGQVFLISSDAHSLAPLLSAMRFLVNLSNRCEEGANALMMTYCNQDGQQIVGLCHILRLMSSLHWTNLSATHAHHDLFNIMQLCTGVIVNCVENKGVGAEIGEVIQQQSNCTMLATNWSSLESALSDSIHISPASAPASTLPALDFFCHLWSYLHSRLQALLGEYDDQQQEGKQAMSAQQPGYDDMDQAATQPLSPDLSMEEAMESDPFAAAAARMAARTTTTTNPADAVQAHLEQQALMSSMDDMMEEQTLGLRTLASICSILLGFFAASSTATRSYLLSLLRPSTTSLTPLMRYIKEFLLLQSDSQVLDQAALEVTIHMLERLEQMEKQQGQDSSTSQGKKALNGDAGDGTPSHSDVPPSKRQRRDSSHALGPASSASLARPPSSHASAAANAFDQLIAHK